MTLLTDRECESPCSLAVVPINVRTVLMQRLGILIMAKLLPNKVHNFFIDLEENDPEIPSDLRGVWATSVSTKGKEQSEVIKEIAEHFFKAQYFIIPDNKMTAIMEWYRVKDYISRHDTDPACSDFELAQ